MPIIGPLSYGLAKVCCKLVSKFIRRPKYEIRSFFTELTK